MRGTGSTICTLQTKACWTTFTSLRVRVIMEPVPNPSKSLAEKVRDLSYRALRMSRPIRAESRAHRKHPTRVPPPETRATLDRYGPAVVAALVEAVDYFGRCLRDSFAKQMEEKENDDNP